MAGIIFGRQPVLEVLKSKHSINKVYIAQGLKGSIIDTIFRLAREAKIVVQFVEKKRLDQITDRANHQGVAAQIASVTYAELDHVLDNLENKKDALLVLLDRVTDPHNLGAIVRSAHQLGADAIIIPKRDACGINETVAKVSAGAIEYLPVVQANNLVQVIEKCKARGFWVAGAESDGKKCFEQDLSGKLMLALGSEGYGLQKLILGKCDFVIAIPQTGKLDSLNVSCAASVLLYEIIRQRLQKS
ncbi:MAG: 23S rRNA (guanosine(2251)-2'-O)-methyltransferase RlmB [bacterium]|nr:23S rRNA (guanosine(2251)-2'-O)-methyltransferase RlmB [bacterium]